MKVLVTGGTGFLGMVLLRRLLEGGESDVRVLVRPATSPAAVAALAQGFPAAHVEICVGSLNSRADCRRAVEGVGLVYHLAAALSGAAADMFLNTVVASRNLLDEMVLVAPRPRLVLVSSFSVYDVASRPRGAILDESMPLEPHPERRDLYSQSKLRQEQLCHEYAERHGLDLVVLRPGVIYGPRGGAISSRVGLSLFGVFLHLGGRNLLPLSFVDNCADAIIVAGRSPAAAGQIFNVHDDDLPTAARFLSAYRRRVTRLRRVWIPYPALLGLSYVVDGYNRYSRGQLPAIFTPYKTRVSWGGNRFGNDKLKAIGWRQAVPTDKGMERTFEYLRSRQTV